MALQTRSNLMIGVLALQGAFLEHILLLQKAYSHISTSESLSAGVPSLHFIEVRTEEQLNSCDALVIPGGESTTISLIAERCGLLEPLRDFVKIARKPTWGTCAGLILLAEAVNATKKGGQEVIGGLDVKVNRNHFGRQIESFTADLELPFLNEQNLSPQATFPGVFLRAPVVERILPHVPGLQEGEAQKADTVVAPSKKAKDDQARSAMSSHVDVLGILPGRLRRAAEAGAVIDSGDEAGDIVAVRQGNVFGTSFHPELTSDVRIHVWWLQQVLQACATDKDQQPGS